MLTVDGDQVSQLLETRDSQQRELEAGLHIAACLLVNDLPLCHEGHSEQVNSNESPTKCSLI